MGNLPKSRGGAKGAFKAFGMTPEKMQALYEAHTDAEIGELVGVSDVAISWYRRRNGIATVTLRQRKDRECEGSTLDDLTPAKLASLYAQMGDREIAELHNTSAPTIRARRRKWGIQPVSKTERATSTVGGWLVLNVDGFWLKGRLFNLVADTENIVLDLGLGSPERLLYDLPGGGTIEDNHETILCWCRGVATPVGVREEPLTFCACIECGDVKPHDQLRGGLCLICDEPKGTPKTCEGCGETFMAQRKDHRFHNEACRARHCRKEQRKLVPAKKARTFTCESCGVQWSTEAKGRFNLCLACKEAKANAPMIKICGYRHCKQPFEDSSLKRSMAYCCVEHRRREKLFRSGKAKDESYFRDPSKEGWNKCLSCGEKWQPEKGKRLNRCLDCREKARHKVCVCGISYRDDSLKNTQRSCESCRKSKDVRRVKVSDRTEGNRRRRVAQGVGGRADVFATLTPFSNSWWGRVGELLFLHLYPDANDAVAEYGNRNSFDLDHRTWGRVDAKTTKVRTGVHGRKEWSFQIDGVREGCDTAFLVGLSAERDKVERVWLVPAKELPEKVKVMSPESVEYTGAFWEVSDGEVALIDRKLTALLSAAKDQTVESVVSDPPRVEYERMILGAIGEAIYKRFEPDARHLAGDDPLAPHDFIDLGGTTVNVRLRRRGVRDRWQFFRSSSPSDEYVFIGLSPDAKTVEVAYRVPRSEMPPKGFSVKFGGVSKWQVYQLDWGLPLPVSDLVDVPDLDQIHVQIMGLTKEVVDAMGDSERECLLKRAFQYHRVLGFPFTTVPLDKRLASFLEGVRAYEPKGKDLLPDNAGLGFCSAYMPHRYEVRNESADFSALGAFWDDERLRRALDFCLRGETPSLRRGTLRGVLTALNRTPTSFKPTVAKALVEAYSSEGDLVLDPCAGWGGRLVGTVVVGRRYVGIEPVKKTADALYRMGSRLCEHLEVDRSMVRIVEGPIQSVPKGSLTADFALTSPPYWTKELYEGFQQISLDAWVSDFLEPFFEVTRSLLKIGGHFAVNIADVRVGCKVIPLERLALEAAQRVGFDLVATWRMMMSSFGGQVGEHFEPVLVFS